jgi:large subunit ribosomal protein L21
MRVRQHLHDLFVPSRQNRVSLGRLHRACDRLDDRPSVFFADTQFGNSSCGKMSRRLLRAALSLRKQTTPSSLVLPLRSGRRDFNTTTQVVEPQQPAPEHAIQQGARPLYSSTSQMEGLQDNSAQRARPDPTTTSQLAAASTGAQQPLWLPDSVRTLLPYLAAQPAQYIRVHIHGFPYLVTAGDQVRLPFRMPGVLPGDVLRLNRASILGSRDFTLQGGTNGGANTDVEATASKPTPSQPTSINGAQMLKQPPYIDERLYECRAVVLGTDSEPLRLKIKKKRRTRRSKTVKSKHRYTLLRISELKVNSIDELEM